MACEHDGPHVGFRHRAGDERNEAEVRILGKVREILETPEGECILCWAEGVVDYIEGAEADHWTGMLRAVKPHLRRVASGP